MTDFNVVEDTLVLDAWLALLGSDGGTSPGLCVSGPLQSYQFHIGASATSDLHRIVYHPKSGALYYDSDGSGPTPAVRFATLSPDLALTGDDFRIVSRTLCP